MVGSKPVEYDFRQRLRYLGPVFLPIARPTLVVHGGYVFTVQQPHLSLSVVEV
jgi:hypothetical protein